MRVLKKRSIFAFLSLVVVAGQPVLSPAAEMFDLSKPSGFNGPSESVLLEALNDGLVYANISDVIFPGGEIRGQLEPVSTGGTVPEPSVLLSVVMGLAAIATQLKRR